jgi:hypothetical protein
VSVPKIRLNSAIPLAVGNVTPPLIGWAIRNATMYCIDEGTWPCPIAVTAMDTGGLLSQEVCVTYFGFIWRLLPTRNCVLLRCHKRIRIINIVIAFVTD